jgi:hypothetical protein
MFFSFLLLVIVFLLSLAIWVLAIEPIISARKYNRLVDNAISKNSKVGYPNEIYDYHLAPLKKALLNNVIKFEGMPIVKTSSNSELKKILLERLSIYLDEIGISEYAFVDISRSNVKDIEPGSYIYKFDKEKNLYLIKSPILVKNNLIIYGQPYSAYDPDQENKIFKIEHHKIQNYYIHGSELIASNVSSSTMGEGPGIFKTGLSEALFGSSYTILKGMKETSISTSHEIKDMRVIQLVFNDSTDIEFQGISIYYDLVRFFGDSSNKGSKKDGKSIGADQKEGLEIEQPNIVNDKDILVKLNELKELHEKNVITEEEFIKIKEKLLKD